MSGDNSFVVVANRLPVDLHGTTWTASPGGLVAALSPVLERRQGCWVGWPGVPDAAPDPFRTDAGLLLHPVRLSQADFEGFYEGFSNASLWPLYHDLIVTPEYHRQWWAAYRDVNLRFAQEVADVAAEGATVWVQDYQLQLVPGILRQLRPDLRIGFFLHIPFPHPDLFRQLPWRDEILRGLADADLVGFHLESSARNFRALCDADVRVGAFPISISLDSLGKGEEGGVERLRAQLGDPRTVILGVDRLDYTKGILQRLLAFEELLEAGALEGAVLLQIATPSRERIDQYQVTRSQVEEAVGRINGRFGSMGHPVVHYLHQSLPKNELRTYYEAADVMLVTPFKDGMNLVAKEYVACHPDGSGALVLSEFAGAAVELHQANLCNPFDLESIKRALLTAVQGLETTPELMAERMTAMYAQVRDHDVDRWASNFLSALEKNR